MKDRIFKPSLVAKFEARLKKIDKLKEKTKKK